MSSKEQLAAIRRRVKKDKKYRRFNDLFESNPNFAMPFEDLHEELTALHTTRKTRHLRRRKNSMSFGHDLVDGMLQDQAARSRATEILAQCVKVTDGMKEMLTNLRDYLSVEYSSMLKVIGTVAERKAFIENVMRPFYQFLNQIETLQQHCNLLITDIDKANYTYKNLVEVLKVLVRPEQVSI